MLAVPGAPSIDPIKAAVAFNLAEIGTAKNEIARRTGISEASVRDILNKHGRWGDICELPVFAKLRAEQNQSLEAAFRIAAAQSLELAMTQEKLAKASYYQLVIGSSVAIDKARLLAGESTSNVAVVHHVEVENMSAAADAIAHSLLRFSQASTTVLELQNEVIDVTPEPPTSDKK